MRNIDAFTLAAIINAWEGSTSALDDAPYDTFRAAHPIEARYLWLLSRSFAPPKHVISQALRNLIAWELIDADATVTPLGKRLLATGKKKLAPDPFASAERVRW